MVAITSILNYAFPTFILRVVHNSTEVVEASFTELECWPCVGRSSAIIPDPGSVWVEGARVALSDIIVAQLNAYRNNGDFIFTLALKYSGTPHQLKVWQALRGIKAGTVLSYGEVAKICSSAPRAVGGACAKNSLPLFIPCHRVIAKTGQLGGFNGGDLVFNLAIKRSLLAHEGIII